MSSASGDEELLASGGAVDLPIDLELDIAVDDHDELVGVVHVVGPELARRIDPEPAGEAALLPAPFDGGSVHAHGPKCTVGWSATLHQPLVASGRKGGASMTVKRMDNVGIVVESLDTAISFFAELGLELEGRTTIEGEWAGRVTGLGDQRVEMAMMRTPDGHSRLELSRFLTPPVVADHRNAPVNALGYLRVMFAVEDIDDTLTRLRKRGAQLVGDVVQYKDAYRLCYIRGPEGLLIGLAQELG